MLKRKSLTDRKTKLEIAEFIKERYGEEFTVDEIEEGWRGFFEKIVDIISDGSAQRVRIPKLGILSPNLSAIDVVDLRLMNPKLKEPEREVLLQFKENVKKFWGLGEEDTRHSG